MTKAKRYMFGGMLGKALGGGAAAGASGNVRKALAGGAAAAKPVMKKTLAGAVGPRAGKPAMDTAVGLRPSRGAVTGGKPAIGMMKKGGPVKKKATKK